MIKIEKERKREREEEESELERVYSVSPYLLPVELFELNCEWSRSHDFSRRRDELVPGNSGHEDRAAEIVQVNIYETRSIVN